MAVMKTTLLLLPLLLVFSCQAPAPHRGHDLEALPPHSMVEASSEAASAARPTAPSPKDQDGSLTLVFENDTFAGSDNNFTTGWSLTYTSSEVGQLEEDRFLRRYFDFWSFLPFLGNEETDSFVTFSFGQSFSTASDISDPNPPLDDQPYAGLLALITGLHSRTPRSLHSWWLLAGIVGPSSLAEEAQTKVHELIDSEIPEGWDTQLENEPVLNVYYDWKHRLVTGDLTRSTSFDLTSSTGAGLGNAWIGGWGSAFGRLGFNMQDNFGPSTPRTGLGGFPINIQPWSHEWQAFAFLGGDVQWVGQNIFLDGNTWTDSRSVDREPWVASMGWGVVLQKGHIAVTWSMYSFTDTYETQLENNEFGAVALSVFL